MSTFEATRPTVGAQALGIARAAYEYALDYAKERKAFGRPIIMNQAIAFKLANMITEIDASRLLIWRAAWLARNGGYKNAEGSMSKYKASEVAVWVTEEAIQILGGYGYTREYPVERWHRDAKIHTIFEGTSARSSSWSSPGRYQACVSSRSDPRWTLRLERTSDLSRDAIPKIWARSGVDVLAPWRRCARSGPACGRSACSPARTPAAGRPSCRKTIHGGKRDALQRVAAEMEVGPAAPSSGGRTVSDVLDAWVEQNLDTWAPSSARDQQSRVRGIKKDQIARLPLARLSVGDVERWHTRLRRDGMRDAGIKNQHGVLRAALAQAVRWGWVEHQRGEHGAAALDEDASGAR